MRKVLLILIAGALALGALAATGCRRVPLDREDRAWGRGTETTSSIALQGAKRLDARIDFGVGELNMDSSDQSATVTTDFDYNPRSWQPKVAYDLSGSTGELRISQPDTHGGARWPFGNVRNNWDLGLPAGVPTTLRVNLGVGESDLILGELALERLDVRMGVGDATIDLSGASKSMSADINAGVGELVLRVPRNVGVRVTGRQDGLGDYHSDGLKSEGDAFVNDAYGTSPVTLDIALRRGVGDVTVELVD